MISETYIVLLVTVAVSGQSCYWNAECQYQLFSTKTPYDASRGDLRDQVSPPNCQPVSIWSLHRHGNRNPGNSATDEMRRIAGLKEEIIASYEAGRGQLCAQDIEDLRRWAWNETMDVSQSQLTGTGYEELYNIGKRIREKYPQLLGGSVDDYYFRPTNEQRTVTSAIAFVHGLTDGTNLTLPIDDPRERDDVIRPYENCQRYQDEVKTSPIIEENLQEYYNTAQFVAVKTAVEQRLGISTQLSSEDIYAFYELCRFYRSWTETKQTPWCAVLSNEDLLVLEYYDDVRHYYRNGYGSWVNVNLGALPMQDFYDNFEAFVQGNGRTITSYFTHDTMMEMVFCALGLFKDATPLIGSTWDSNRLWMTSRIGCLSVNLIAVLNSCQESGGQSYRVQIFINEKETALCPSEGCTWQEFQEKFQGYTDNLDFCSMDYVVPEADNAVACKGVLFLVVLMQLFVTAFWNR